MKKQTKKTTIKTTQLDEDTSARVIAEYLAIVKVAESEIDSILNRGSARGAREIALTFRVSEVLGIPAPFKIAPRFKLALERAREYLVIHRAATEHAQTEARS